VSSSSVVEHPVKVKAKIDKLKINFFIVEFVYLNY
jgi:hypothetical protein